MIGIQEDTRPVTRSKPETHTTTISPHESRLGSQFPSPILQNCRDPDHKPQTPAIQILLYRAKHDAPKISAGETKIGLKRELASLGLNEQRLVELRELHLLGGVEQGDLHAIVHRVEVAVRVGENKGNVAVRRGGGGADGNRRHGGGDDVQLRESRVENHPK